MNALTQSYALTDSYRGLEAAAFRAVLERLEARGVTADRLPRAALLTEVTAAMASVLEASRAALNAAERARLAEDLMDELLGLGPLEALLSDDTVDDILVNGPRQIFVERQGRLQLAAARFRDDAHLLAVIQRIVGAVGRRVDEATPFCDARLADGSRVNVVIPPVAIDGASISIRKPRRQPLSGIDLVRSGAMPRAVLDYLTAAVQARLNILVIGGTGSGKTTLLNVLSAAIDPAERLVTIEDAAELRLVQPHVVRLETRPPGLDGRQAISTRELTRNAMRMRPDRLLLGEVRGPEAVEMLQAMSTGHDGSMSTLHANSARDALWRLEMLLGFSGLPLEPRALRRFVASSVQLIVGVQRAPDGQRRVMEVAELCGIDGDVYQMHELWSHGQSSQGRGAIADQSRYAARLAQRSHV
ncbi:CpaF family protein [Roseomonas sp. 18066]|uniref:CpaF family protein n=1 Tax=Roseomonas sp. 18066 TaxID=2681412 RepID=UPI00135784E9|nr:CpaF family protein [Roseomonas sp. 18066]